MAHVNYTCPSPPFFTTDDAAVRHFVVITAAFLINDAREQEPTKRPCQREVRQQER